MAEIEKVFFVKDHSIPISEELPKIIWYLQTMGIPVYVDFDHFRKGKIKAFTVSRDEARRIHYVQIDKKSLKEWCENA